MAHMSVDGLHDLPSRGSQTLQSGGRNQKWPTSGLCAYITPVLLGVPNPSKRWTKSEVAHMGAWWQHDPKSLGGPQRFKAGNKIRSGPHVGRLPTSPSPYGVPNT